MTARVWDARTGATLATLSGHSITLFTAAFSPDGSRIVTASADKTARVWDVTPEGLRRGKEAYRSALAQRAAALKALDCDAAKMLNSKLGGDTYPGCAFDKLLNSGAARDLYLEAGKYERNGDRDRARKLYTAIVEKHAKDDLALKASDSLNAMARTESVERSNANAAAQGQAAAEAQKAASEAQRQAVEQVRRDANDRERRAKEDFCRQSSGCHTSCYSFSGQTRNACHSQCYGKFPGC